MLVDDSSSTNENGSAGNSDYLDEERPSLQVSDSGEGPDVQNICAVIELSFEGNVECNCVGTLYGSFSIACDYAEPVCNDSDKGRTCGKPKVAVTMVNGVMFSATTCVLEYKRGTVELADTCVFVDACQDDEEGFCDCTASYDGKICRSCDVCDGGQALTVDCTNINVEAVSKQCSPVDMDLHLDGGAGHLAGFGPVFSGFCSNLESNLENRIACDCTDAVGGTFSITCETVEHECFNDHCGNVVSRVDVVEGDIYSVTACATYDAPFEGETCTALQFSEATGGISGCVAHYDDTRCNYCGVCADGKSLKLDCSNVFHLAVISECQEVSRDTSYEFLPNYDFPREDEAKKVVDPLSALSFKQHSSAKRVVAAVVSSKLLLVLMCFLL